MIHPSMKPYLPQVIELLKSRALMCSVLTDHFNEQSDVDFLVNIQEGLDPVETGGHLWDLTYELEDLLKRHVDLLTEKSLKNQYFINQVNETKYPIYG
jgi:predicted nucleotidyltransferase